MSVYVPKQGDIIIVTFDPQSGHEQFGRRPAFVVSQDLFNRQTGMAIVCPITNTNRNFPFHVEITKHKTTGFVMVEQAKSIDYSARNAQFYEQGSGDLLLGVISLLYACIY